MPKLLGAAAATDASPSASNSAPDPVSPDDTKKFVKDEAFSFNTTLTYSDDWTKVIDTLPGQDTHGNKYYYYIESVEETGMPDGTEATIVLDGENKLLVSEENAETTPLKVKNTVSELTTDISILKVEAGTTTPLTGAKFKLHQYKDSTYKEKLRSWDEQEVSSEESTKGTLSFEGLTEGFYEIEETQSPDGYVRVDANPRFEVRKQGRELVVVFTNTDLVTYSNKIFTVGNTPGTELPHTGGIGTTIFYVLGSLLVITGGIFLIARRRMAR
jgi:LPXTG-motif cell wall-anchored protein